jgi:hypothetical protein
MAVLWALRGIIDVLPLAAAACRGIETEVPAARRDPIRRRFDHAPTRPRAKRAIVNNDHAPVHLADRLSRDRFAAAGGLRRRSHRLQAKNDVGGQRTGKVGGRFFIPIIQFVETRRECGIFFSWSMPALCYIRGTFALVGDITLCMKKTSRSRSLQVRGAGHDIHTGRAIRLRCLEHEHFRLVWIWGTFALAAVVTYLVIGSKLLPVEDNRTEQRKATDAFRRSLLGQDQFIALVRDGAKVHETGTPLSSLTGVHGVIVADGVSVVALRTSTGVSRAAGAHIDDKWKPHSGVVFTEFYEEIDTIVDLRPQVRRKEIEAQTRDGIRVRATITLSLHRASRAHAR